MTRRRRSNANEVVTIYWRDIPAQVTASVAGQKQKALLTDRFQHAIDRAAAVAGLTETQAYVGEWRRVTSPVSGDLGQAQATAAQLEEDYPRPRLEALVATGGLDQNSTNLQETTIAATTSGAGNTSEESQ